MIGQCNQNSTFTTPVPSVLGTAIFIRALRLEHIKVTILLIFTHLLLHAQIKVVLS